MALGLITVRDTLEWSATGGTQAGVEVRDGIIAVLFDRSNTARCATFSCDASGNLTKLDEQTLTGITHCGVVFSAIKITDGIVAFTYISSTPYPYKGDVATVSIDAAGAITVAVLDTLEFEATSCYHSFIVHATGDMWVIAYSNYVGDDSYIVTVDIDSAGAIANAVVASQVLTSNFSNHCNVIKIADGKIAIFYSQSTTGSTVETRTISAAGAISAVIGTAVWEASAETHLRPFAVGETIYACSYADDATGDGFVVTFDIATDGTITTAGVDTLEYETVDVDRYPVGAAGGGVACFCYPDNDNYIQFKTVDIDNSGNIGAVVLFTELLDGVSGADFTNIVKISNTLYVAFWNDTNSNGQAASLSVNTSPGEAGGVLAIVETRIHYLDKYGTERYIQGTVVV